MDQAPARCGSAWREGRAFRLILIMMMLPLAQADPDNGMARRFARAKGEAG